MHYSDFLRYIPNPSMCGATIWSRTSNTSVHCYNCNPIFNLFAHQAVFSKLQLVEQCRRTVIDYLDVAQEQKSCNALQTLFFFLPFFFLFLFYQEQKRVLVIRRFAETGEARRSAMYKKSWQIRCGMLHCLVSKCKQDEVDYTATNYGDFCEAMQNNDKTVMGPFTGIDQEKNIRIMFAWLPTSDDEGALMQKAKTLGVGHIFFVCDKELCKLLQQQKTRHESIEYVPVGSVLYHPQMEVSRRRWRIRMTLLQMLKDRGHTVIPNPIQEVDFYNCSSAEQLESYMTIFALSSTPVAPAAPIDVKSAMQDDDQAEHKMQDDDKSLTRVDGAAVEAKAKARKLPLVIALYRSELKVPILRALLAKFQDRLTGLVLVANKIVSQVRNFLESENKNQRLQYVWIFHDDKLVNNPKNHEWQPKFRVVGEEEKKLLGKRFLFAKMQKIEVTDIMAQYYGVRVGDIMEIIEMTDHLGEIERYRYVIPRVHQKTLLINKAPVGPRENTGAPGAPLPPVQPQNEQDIANYDDVRKMLQGHDGTGLALAPSAARSPRIDV